jgi:hypothetical protein
MFIVVLQCCRTINTAKSLESSDMGLRVFVRNIGLNRVMHTITPADCWLVQAGVSLYLVGKLLGHSSTTVTEKYAHLVPSDMHNLLGPLHLDN